jgi:hypothetical protein
MALHFKCMAFFTVGPVVIPALAERVELIGDGDDCGIHEFLLLSRRKNAPLL